MRVSALRSLLGASSLACVLTVAAGALSAAPISGLVNISGAVGVSANMIDFQLPVDGGNGVFTVSATGNTGSFAGLSNTTGQILDLNIMSQMIGSSFSLPGFIRFDAAPNIVFNLTSILPGAFSSAQCSAPAATGQTCTPAGSAFMFTNNTATSSSVSLSATGTVTNTADNSLSTFSGVFTTQFAQLNYQQLLAITGSGGTVNTSYSGSFVANVTPTPEPSTLALFGSALIGLAGLSRRYRRQR